MLPIRSLLFFLKNSMKNENLSKFIAVENTFVCISLIFFLIFYECRTQSKILIFSFIFFHIFILFSLSLLVFLVLLLFGWAMHLLLWYKIRFDSGINIFIFSILYNCHRAYVGLRMWTKYEKDKMIEWDFGKANLMSKIASHKFRKGKVHFVYLLLPFFCSFCYNYIFFYNFFTKPLRKLRKMLNQNEQGWVPTSLKLLIIQGK